MKNILGILILLFSHITFAQDSFCKFQKLFKIKEVKVIGTKKVEPEAILEKLTLKNGSTADSCTLRSDIKSIYEMKYFETVEAHREDGNLVLKIKEKPIISAISFDGNDEIGDDDLSEQIKTREYNILDVNTIKGDIQLLQKHYEEKGYFLATADYELVKNEQGSLDLSKNLIKFE